MADSYSVQARGWRRVAPVLLALALAFQATPDRRARAQPEQEEAATTACPRPGRAEPTAWRVEGHDQLNAMRGAVDATLKSVEVRALGLSGEVLGFRAGADYGLIYAR